VGNNDKREIEIYATKIKYLDQSQENIIPIPNCRIVRISPQELETVTGIEGFDKKISYLRELTVDRPRIANPDAIIVGHPLRGM